jgi:transcriptional regulator
MNVFGADRSSRLLKIYSKLVKGYIVNKREEADNFNVDERTIQRDITSIKDYMCSDMASNGIINSIVYDKEVGGYKMESSYQGTLSNSETLAVCKVLLDSRAFPKDEMQAILDKLISCCVPKENRQPVKELIGNEEHHYIELRHKTNFLDTLWDLGQAIRSCKYVELEYRRTKDKTIVKRKLKPVGIMFSEYYFYITAFIDDKEVCENFDVINDSFPTIYRVDRIVSYKVLEDRFKMPYKDRFEEGEFRKRIQFMYGGKINRIRFEYTGSDVDAILDRLPTAKIESEKDGKYIIRAEVFGKGIDMWLRSQGENVMVI